MRAAEGARLLAMARGHIDEIERLAEAARGCAATQPQALRQRLTEQLALLLEESAGVSEDRLAQELAMLAGKADVREERSEEHTSELQSLMRISYAVFCLKKTQQNTTTRSDNIRHNK